MSAGRSRAGTPMLWGGVALGLAAVALVLLSGLARGQQDGVDASQACPVEPPTEQFADRGNIPQAHLANVDCAAFFEIVQGFGDNTYRPRARVRRDQIASFIARTLQAANVELPDASQGRSFTDVGSGNPHADNIARLAAAGIVEGGPGDRSQNEYGPALPTRRDQMTSLIIRAVEFAADIQFASQSQQFGDVPPGNVHYDNVNVAAKAGIVQGFTENTFGPGQLTRRDQLASFTVRVLRVLATPAGIAITDQSHERQALGENITLTATVFTQYQDQAEATDGQAVFTGGTEVTFQAEHEQSATAVTPQSATVTTGDNGQAVFSFSSDTEGSVTVTAAVDGPGGNFAHGDGAQVTVEKTFAVDASDDAAGLDLAPSSASNVTGSQHTLTATATDQNADPLANATVRSEVYRQHAGEDTYSLVDVQHNSTGEAGTTEVTYAGPSSPAADVIVACIVGVETDPDNTEPVCADTTTQGGAIVDVQPRGDVVGDEAAKRWVSPDTPGTITGTVTDPDGNPIGLATVNFQGQTSAQTTTDLTTGRYQSPELDPGGYTLTVDIYNCANEPLDVTLEPGANLTGVDLEGCSLLPGL